MKLYLENVRSFEGWHEIPIAPATVLLGENSAGKSTLLGMLAVVHHDGFPFSGNFFNQFPFEFGGYKTICNNRKSVGYFSVGFETKDLGRFGVALRKDEEPVETGLIVAFRENDGLPVPCHVFVWRGNNAIAFYEPEFKNLDRSNQIKSSVPLRVQPLESAKSMAQGLTNQSMFRLLDEMRGKGEKFEFLDGKKREEFEYLIHQFYMGGLMRSGGSHTMAFAPMRSRPKRTYDQLSDEFSPEGDHIPLLLARATDPENRQAKALHGAIHDFGSYSEMFSDVSVKKLGRGSGDPFQVQVKIGSKHLNLMDVGYGVSQILPLIVDAQRSGQNTTLLLQQPEVHLHPKAQAALGSMIKDWVSKRVKKTVVVETHSDYLVDRLRLEVKKRNLSVGDVRIFFLEKKSGQTRLHALSVDEQGNILNAPDGYRDFFLREQMALLGD
jgi:energy-coupling factor transporter ATP-binding protein EcfA2